MNSLILSIVNIQLYGYLYKFASIIFYIKVQIHVFAQKNILFLLKILKAKIPPVITYETHSFSHFTQRAT